MFYLIFSNREELVKIIGQLKSGEEITPSTVANNEDSSSAEVPPPPTDVSFSQTYFKN